MSHAEQHRDYPRGTPVIAADGELLGTIDVVHPHFFLVRDDAQRHLDLQVPVHAIGSYDGERLYLTVNRETLSSVDDEESVARRLHESEMDED